jgi:hypothetical protein
MGVDESFHLPGNSQDPPFKYGLTYLYVVGRPWNRLPGTDQGVLVRKEDSRLRGNRLMWIANH